jgi:hypothetical protein
MADFLGRINDSSYRRQLIDMLLVYRCELDIGSMRQSLRVLLTQGELRTDEDSSCWSM